MENRNSSDLENAEAGLRPASCRLAVPTEDILGTGHHTKSPANPKLSHPSVSGWLYACPSGVGHLGWRPGWGARGRKTDSRNGLVLNAMVSLMPLLLPSLCPSHHTLIITQFPE